MGKFLFKLGGLDCVAHFKFGDTEFFIEFLLFLENICCLVYNSSIIQFKFFNCIVSVVLLACLGEEFIIFFIVFIECNSII